MASFYNLILETVEYEDKQVIKFAILNKIIEKVKQSCLKSKLTSQTPSPKREGNEVQRRLFLNKTDLDERSSTSSKAKHSKIAWAEKIVIEK